MKQATAGSGEDQERSTARTESTRDATVCARTVCGRVEPVSGYLRHLATSLDRVDWPAGTGGQQAILDAADALDDLRKDSERMEWCERHMQEANVFDPPSGDAWVWALSYYASADDCEADKLSETAGGTLREAIDAAMAASTPDPDAASVVLAVDPSRSTP